MKTQDDTNNNLLMEPIPTYNTTSNIISFISSTSIDSQYIQLLKNYTNYNDDDISTWLNMNVKTFRSYKKNISPIRPDIQEHTICLLSLVKHGVAVFGSKEVFGQWLNTPNTLLEGKKPSSFLNTISGIQFIDNRLTGIEYGDNA